MCMPCIWSRKMPVAWLWFQTTPLSTFHPGTQSPYGEDSFLKRDPLEWKSRTRTKQSQGPQVEMTPKMHRKGRPSPCLWALANVRHQPSPPVFQGAALQRRIVPLSHPEGPLPCHWPPDPRGNVAPFVNSSSPLPLFNGAVPSPAPILDRGSRGEEADEGTFSDQSESLLSPPRVGFKKHRLSLSPKGLHRGATKEAIQSQGPVSPGFYATVHRGTSEGIAHTSPAPSPPNTGATIPVRSNSTQVSAPESRNPHANFTSPVKRSFKQGVAESPALMPHGGPTSPLGSSTTQGNDHESVPETATSCDNMFLASSPTATATDYELSQSAGSDKETEEDSYAPSEPLCWSGNCVKYWRLCMFVPTLRLYQCHHIANLIPVIKFSSNLIWTFIMCIA